MRNLYLTVSKGYKAGGFNTQMFSDVLQQEMTAAMGFGRTYDVDDVVTYEPEQSWNYELGGHFSCMEGAVRGDFALFWIDCRNQQLTVFPEGSTTGRLMTNAGRTRSFGAEAAVRFTPWRNLGIDTSYGYTDARFVRYDDGQEDFGGNRIPYAPQHTFSARAVWTLPRRRLAGRPRAASRRPRHGTHLVERSQFAVAALLRAPRRLGAPRTRPLFDRSLGPQPRRHILRRLLFQVRGQ